MKIINSVPSFIPLRPHFVQLPDHHKCRRVETKDGRRYELPSGELVPSVTSITGVLSEQYITEWRNKVGHETADRISSKAAARGTLIHELQEKYLLGESVSFNQYQFVEQAMFNSLVVFLNSIDYVYCLETVLYSNVLKCAGTVDCIAEVDGKLAVIDYKTSSRVKTEEDITGYYMQCAAYAYMFHEMFGITIKDIIIPMTVENHGLIVFREKTINWVGKFVRLRKACGGQVGTLPRGTA